MAGDFDIQVEPAQGLLRVRMRGFFTLADVKRYHHAIDAASRALPIPPADQLMINDISDMQVQSQEIIAAFQQVVADPRYRDRRVGFVVESALARMQLSRVITGRVAQVFATADDAEAWLFAPAAPASPAMPAAATG